MDLSSKWTMLALKDPGFIYNKKRETHPDTVFCDDKMIIIRKRKSKIHWFRFLI